MTLDTTLWLAGVSCETAIIAVLLTRRVYRTLPVFFSYIIWTLLSDAGGFTLGHIYPAGYLRLYLATSIVDSIFQFGVLIELSMSVLRPIRSFLPRGAIVGVAVLIGLICAAIWPFARSPEFDQISFDGRLLIHMRLTFSVLRILFFLLIAGCSQLLSIGWRDRELQIATGLGVYSLASLSVSLLHTSQAVGGSQYRFLDVMVMASYLCSLLYWVYSFAQKAPERRKFTPQMEGFLLAMAGNAHATRMALTDSSKDKTGRRGKL